MTEATTQSYQGGCLCGAVRYEVDGPPVVVAHCHCINCQKASGSSHSTGAMFRDEQIRLTGNVAEYKYKADSGHEVTRVFCPTCSSSILGHNTGMMGFSTITLGTLDDSSEFEPQVTIFARNRKAWGIGSRPIRWCNSAGQVRRNVVRTVSQRLGPPVLMHHHG